jgi:hypothetical protein
MDKELFLILYANLIDGPKTSITMKKLKSIENLLRKKELPTISFDQSRCLIKTGQQPGKSTFIVNFSKMCRCSSTCRKRIPWSNTDTHQFIKLIEYFSDVFNNNAYSYKSCLAKL